MRCVLDVLYTITTQFSYSTHGGLQQGLLSKPCGGLSTPGSPSRRLLKNDFMSELASSASTPVVTSRPARWRVRAERRRSRQWEKARGWGFGGVR